MKKSTFAIGIIATLIAIWGLMNPLSYINSFSFIDRLLVGGTMGGTEGLIGAFVMFIIMMVHGGFIISFWVKVARRIQEVLAD